MSGSWLSVLLSWTPFVLLIGAWILTTRFFRQRTPHGKYHVIYHVGETLSLRTKALEGCVELTEHALKISGPTPVDLPVREFRRAELFRLRGLGYCIRISHGSGTVYLSVVRLVLFGNFAIVNFFQMVGLARRLRDAIVSGART
jgi:hypothetical protein